MTKHKNMIIEKFIKKDRICNICQQTKGLSEDHVPPKVCPPVKSRVISKLLYQMAGDKSFKPRISQNGVTFKTICRECNSILGEKYDWKLGELSRQIESFIGSNIYLPESFEVECYPNAIMRSILGHLLAAKTVTDDVVLDNLIRPLILDDTLPIPEEIQIFYWVYPYENIIILRDFAMPFCILKPKCPLLYSTQRESMVFNTKTLSSCVLGISQVSSLASFHLPAANKSRSLSYIDL